MPSEASGHRLIDVGGYRLAIAIEGTGSPPVVFVSGSGGDAAAWEAVLAALRVPTTLVTYGRPSLGGSDPLPAEVAATPEKPSGAAAQLRTLLGRAGVQSPRVLVGFSVGGPIVEAYAAQWPAEIGGLVAVDASDPRSFLDTNQPVTADGEVAGGIRFDWHAGYDEQRRRPPVVAPSVVVTSAVGRWLRVEDPDRYRPFSLAQLDELWQRYQRELAARTNSVQVLAHTAGHRIHEEASELVALVVDTVVAAARDGGALRLDHAALDDAGGRVLN